jgi:glycosyltransferase involved in cell wall biosynthesis
LQELKTLSEQHSIGQSIIFLQEHAAVSDAARRDLFLLADLLLFPSAQEGFGIPILEGGAARLPVFCSDIAPFRETAGERAHYFALDDPPERIAERIHSTLFADHAYQLRARVLRDYDWERIWSARLAPLLHEALA